MVRKSTSIPTFKLERSYHLASGTLLGLLSLFLPRKRRVIFNSALNRFYNFNTKYLFEYFLQKNSVPVYFIVDDEKLREQLTRSHGNWFISSKGFSNKMFILCSSAWVTSTMETPVGGIFLCWRRFVYHLGHGVPVKRAGSAEAKAKWYKKLYYRFVETNFSAFLAPTEDAISRYQEVYGCSSLKMVVNPQPRLSIMFPSKTRSSEKFKVLYAPTWRGMDAVKLFPFPDYNEQTLVEALEKHNVEIVLHPHPIRSQVNFSAVTSPRLKVVFDKPGEDVNQYLSHYDLLITDYSSIFVEFLALNRPVIFMPYDYQTFGDSIGMFDYHGDLSTGPHVHSQEDFVAELVKFIQGRDDFKKQRELLSLKLNGADFESACEINYNYILTKLGN